MSDAPEKPAPFEMTIKIDPTAARRAWQASVQTAKALAEAVTGAAYALRIPLLIVATALLAGIAAAVSGSGRPLGIAAAGLLVYSLFWLKARYSPLIPD